MSQTLVCPGSINTTTTPPTCSVAWIAVDSGLGFDVSALDPGALVGAFAAGASVVWLPFATTLIVTHVLKFIRGRG